MKKNQGIIIAVIVMAMGVLGLFMFSNYTGFGKNLPKNTPTGSTPADAREAAIQNRIAEIKKDANYMDAVKKDAAKKGITLNEALIQSATYSVDFLTGY